MQARFGGQMELAEPFDGIDIALPHDAHAHQQKDENHPKKEQKNSSHRACSQALNANMLAWPAAGASETGLET